MGQQHPIEQQQQAQQRQTTRVSQPHEPYSDEQLCFGFFLDPDKVEGPVGHRTPIDDLIEQGV